MGAPNYNGVFDEVFALVTATWPEINFEARDTQEVRINWLDLVRKAQKGETHGIVPPAVILAAATTEEDSQWSIDSYHKRLPITIYYISGNSDGTTAYRDVAAVVMGRLQVLSLALWGDTFSDPKPSFHTFQVMEAPDVDISQTNIPNTLFAQNNWPFFAGFLSFKPLVEA